MADASTAAPVPSGAPAGPGPLVLLRALTARQLRLRSKRSVIGIVWPIVAPLPLLALYVFVFHHVFDVPIRDYPIYLAAGLLPWAFLTQTLGAALPSLSNEPELIRRTRFAYELIPIATVTAMSLYFVVTLAGFVLYLAVTRQLVFALLPVLLVPVASLYLFVAALAVGLALLDVYNRDLRQLLANLLTVWFFLVPIVYQQERLGSGLGFMQSVDPVNVLVGEFREVLYYGHVSRVGHLVFMLAACAAIWLASIAIFRRFAARLPKDV